MKKRIIAVFTGNRAEYGLQYPIIKAIVEHPNLEYRLLVSGAHLDNNFGNTLEEIKNDGFHIDYEIKIETDVKHDIFEKNYKGNVSDNLSYELKYFYAHKYPNRHK